MAARRVIMGAAIVSAVGLAAAANAPRAQAASVGVLYHDQSGTVLTGMAPAQAARLASRRLGFVVALPATWPHGAPLRALWVMDRHTPRFVVLYYGGSSGEITCQLHESLGVSRANMSWAPQTPEAIGRARGVMYTSWQGGAHPTLELAWRAHGVYFDLLGTGTTTLKMLLAMAVSL